MHLRLDNVCLVSNTRCQMVQQQTLAERVRLLRSLSGLSQREIGARCGLTGATVGQVETAERKTPAGETLLKLAHVFGTTVEYLLTGIGPEPTKESVGAALSREASAEPAPTFPADGQPASGGSGHAA